MKRSKMKGKSLPLFFSTLLILTLIFGFAVTPVLGATDGVITLTDWEDIPAGDSENISGYIDLDNTNDPNDWKTSTGWANSGSKSFYMFTQSSTGHTPSGWWNLTSTYSYIGEIDFWFYLSMYATPQKYEMMFYDNTTVVLRLQIDGNDLDFYDVSTGWTEIDGGINGVNQIVIQHNDTNMMYYQTYNNLGVLQYGIEGASASSNTWTSFDKVYFSTTLTGGGQMKMYFDDINISTEKVGEGGDTGIWLSFGDIDCTYKCALSFASNPSEANPSEYLEIERNSYMTCILKQFEILMPYHDASGNFPNYIEDYGWNTVQLVINGELYGTADACNLQYCTNYVGDTFSLLMWTELGKTLIGKKPRFELKFLAPMPNEYAVCIVPMNYGDNTDYDLDNDGKCEFKYHGASDDYGNGLYDGNIWVDSADSHTTDIAYRCWYIIEDTGADGYEDTISVSEPIIGFHDTVRISYTANLTDGNRRLTIDDADGIELLNISCENYGVQDFNPTVYDTTPADGIYHANITLTDGTVKAGVMFTVVNDSGSGGANYQIWMAKKVYAPAELGSEKIYYRYNATYNTYTGYISLRDSSDNEKAYWEISDDDWDIHYVTGMSSLDVGGYTLKLFSNSNGTLYYKDGYTFSVETSQGGQPFLEISRDVIELGDSITVSGYHDNVGFNVFLRILPTYEEIDVSSSNTISYTFTPQQSGDYFVYLYLDSNQLCLPVSFTVIDIGADADADSTIRFMIGFGILITLICVGVGIMSKMRQESAIFIPIMFGLVGCVIGVLFEFFPMYVLLIFGILMSALITYWIMAKRGR